MWYRSVRTKLHYIPPLWCIGCCSVIIVLIYFTIFFRVHLIHFVCLYVKFTHDLSISILWYRVLLRSPFPSTKEEILAFNGWFLLSEIMNIFLVNIYNLSSEVMVCLKFLYNLSLSTLWYRALLRLCYTLMKLKIHLH